MKNNYLMPFLWVHGEDESTYRKMVHVIHDSGIGAFCVEARPHPDFVQERWWKDMEILLDEAEKLGMKVWILDDKHFPTGYAAGALEDAPLALRRRHIMHKSMFINGGKHIRIGRKKLITVRENAKHAFWNAILQRVGGHKPAQKIRQDELLSCVAYNSTGYIDLMEKVTDYGLDWKAPKGNWRIEICTLTYDSGSHRNYINMLDEDSCKVLVDTVYETHYAHFKDKFGSVIAGFFSDEPEIGNGSYACWNNVLGTRQSLPYSEVLKKGLRNG